LSEPYQLYSLLPGHQGGTMPAPPQRQHRIRVMKARGWSTCRICNPATIPGQQIALSDRDGRVHSRCMISVVKSAAVLGAI
jgi:hypothetical protein